MRKRWLAVMCAVALMGGLAGCTGGNKGGPAQPQTESAGKGNADSGTAAEEPDAAETDAKSTEGETKLWIAIREDINNLPTGSTEVLKKAVKEKFHVDLRVDCINKSNYEEKINVMIASGEFPDIIDSNAILRLGEAVEGGLLLSMDDFVAEDEQWSEADPAIFEKFSYHDTVYGLPVVMDRPDSIYYRVDWLDKLGLSIPTNADELYEVLRAFAKDDPDGNGKDDTYGLSISSDYLQTAPFWQLFLETNPIGTDLGFYIDPASGKADNVFYHREEMEAALNWFRRLYDEGILDQEFVLNTGEDAESKFITGKSGSWCKGIMWIEPRQSKLSAANPDAKVLSFPGIQGLHGSNLKIQPVGRALYLTRAASDNQELAMQVLAYIAGADGMKDLFLGKEGETYKVKDGVIEWTNPDDANKYNPGNILSSPFKLELPVPSPLLEENLEITSGYELAPLIQISESPTFNEKGADMKKIILEGITKIIIGEQQISYLDTIIEDLNSVGMNEVCKELNSQK